MPLLAEYALTPDVLDSTSYDAPELCLSYLQMIKDPLLTDGLVADLSDGNWRTVFSDADRSWHPRGKELVKKLTTQKRLICRERALDKEPNTDTDWCDEALATHSADPLAGIVVTDSIAEAYASYDVVAPIHKLASAPWWAQRSPSVRIRRTLSDYVDALTLVLRHANSIMFIDPHVDPTRHGYRQFGQLVAAAGNRTVAPLIEIHRGCKRGSGPQAEIIPNADLEAMFQTISPALTAAGLEAKVFVWDEFHDRHVVSDLVGILMGNGFDTNNNPLSKTTWTRLGRDDRDDIQREFEEASGQHRLIHDFTLP